MEDKKSAALPQTERLIECLDEHIRNIVKDELDRRAWDNLRAIYPPEFVQGLEEVFRGQQRDFLGDYNTSEA